MNYKNNINEIIKLIEENHIDAYFNISKNELNKYIEYVLDNYKLEDEYDFYYIVNMIIKKMFGRFDSHTKLVFYNTDGNLPIRLKYIYDKLYIVQTDLENNNYSQILKINDIDINILIDELEKMVAYSTKEFLDAQIEFVFYNISKLKALPSIKSDCNKFKYTILNNDKIEDIYLEKSDMKAKQLDNYKIDIKDDIMIIKYSKCREEYENQMNEFVKKIEKEAKINNITKYIVDIRGNQGGNFSIINPLINYLKDKEIVTLIDKYVFSAGRFAIYDLKNINSKFIGTGIGTSMNCFGNAPTINYKNYLLPISNKYYYMDEMCSNVDKADTKESFDKLKEHYNISIPQIFKPDYYIENTIEDYKNGKDNELEYAINILKQNKKIK